MEHITFFFCSLSPQHAQCVCAHLCPWLPTRLCPWRDLQGTWDKAKGKPKWGSCLQRSLLHSSRMQLMSLCPYTIKRITKCSQVFWPEQRFHSPFPLMAGFRLLPFCTECWLSPPSPSCSSGWDIRRAVCGPGQLLIHTCSRRNWGLKEKVCLWSGTYFSWYQKCLEKWS